MPVTSESEYLQSLARTVVAATIERIPTRAAVLAGSAGRGNADGFSDLDILFYADTVPSSEAIDDLRTAVGGVDPLRRQDVDADALRWTVITAR